MMTLTVLYLASLCTLCAVALGQIGALPDEVVEAAAQLQTVYRPCPDDLQPAVCNFEKEPTLCSWTSTQWHHGEERAKPKLHSVLLDAPADANRVTIDGVRWHAEAISESLSGEDNVVMSSAEIVVPANTEFRFKYFMNRYGASLSLCLDDAKCAKPLWRYVIDDALISKMKAAGTLGQLRVWRPCIAGSESPCSDEVRLVRREGQWECAPNVIAEAVKLPAGKHTLHWVASGVSKYNSISVDALHFAVGGEPCGLEAAACGEPTVCWQEQARTQTVFNNGRAIAQKLPEDWARGSNTVLQVLDNCKRLCERNMDCQSVVVFDPLPGSTEPEYRCILYMDRCEENCSPQKGATYIETLQTCE